MSVLFWISFIPAFLAILYNMIVKKEIFSIYLYTLIGIYIPLILSFVDWSNFHVQDKSSTFYFIFFCLNITCLFYTMKIKYGISSLKNMKLSINKKRRVPFELYCIVYIVCILIENKFISGYFFPSFKGIDVHTERMPFIYFITTATYIVVIGNIIEFLSTKKIKYLIYAVFCFLFNIISKASRIDAFLCIAQTGSFLGFYFLSKESKISIEKSGSMKKKNKILLGICSIIVIYALVSNGINVGNNRMNSNGKYSIKYSDGIAYTGPETSNELIAYYYGYFALSFDNLDYNICNASTINNFVGLNSFRCLYFGILQFDNIIGLDGGASSRANIIRCKAAAVPTIFWDFYYDYDILAFIPIFITYIIAAYLTYKLVVTQKMFYLLVYFYWVPMWMFASFDNRIYDFQVLWHILIIWVMYKQRYELNIVRVKNNEY